MASTLYLESYVESTSSLPTELQRLLTTIKALDERSAILLEQVREASQAIIDMPPPTTRKMREEQVGPTGPSWHVVCALHVGAMLCKNQSVRLGQKGSAAVPSFHLWEVVSA